jgi:hypothetical protein
LEFLRTLSYLSSIRFSSKLKLPASHSQLPTQSKQPFLVYFYPFDFTTLGLT